MQHFANLAGQAAVITGASSGIGRAIAFEFANAGAAVMITCRSSVDRLKEVTEELKRRGAHAEPFVSDLAAPDAADELVGTAWERLGPITIWINNAGADLLTGEGPKLSYEEKLQRLWEVDVAATIRMTRTAGRRMKQHGGGVILNVGWDQADRGMEGDSGELFSAAKNAIMGFTRSAAVSLAPEVRVNCLAPGWIRTAWGEGASEAWQERVIRETPLRRWGTPQDIANAARFLSSDAAAFITGQILNVNGGAVR